MRSAAVRWVVAGARAAVRPLARSLRRDAAALRSRVTWRPPRVPARRLLVGLLAFVVGLIFGPTPPALVAGLRAGAQTPPAQAEQPATSHATADPDPVTVPTSAIADDSDVLVVGTPSEDGYLLEVSAAETGWQPQPLAALTTGPVETRAWIGYECTTGDGRFVVAVVAPWEATNRPELRDHGAVAFGVEIRTRKVTRLADGVALKHFNPGCGEHTAGLVRHKGVDQARSTVLVVDPASGEVVSDVDLDGQVVGAVPADGTTFVFRDQSVARLDDDGDEVDAQPTGGQPYMAAASPGGVTFLAASGDKAKVRRLADGDVETLGSFALGEVKLHGGLHGDVAAVVRGAGAGDRAEGLRWVERPAGAPMPDAVSGEASTLLTSTEGATAAPTEAVVTRSGDVVFERPRPQVDMALPDEVVNQQVTPADLAAAAPNTTTPVCAVPRNDPQLMARQATPDQVRWAIEQSVTENTGFSRPAGYLFPGSAGYAPSSVFPVPDLTGPTKQVPASVAWGTFVQESNWKQASRRSLAGSSANPTIASYYGAPFDDPTSVIDYNDADCGYGLAQVTDGMRNDDGLRTATDEKRIALDYYANASAGVKILADKWNQVLAQPGMHINNDDARYLENWYFALWAYNTGWNPDDGAGHFGLGWTNNPRNSDYPPDRQPFLRFDLDDARHPGDWPYQERVFGWMESPLWDIGNPQIRFYPRPQNDALLKIPGINTFCTADNNCNPNDPPSETAYCHLADRHCWWHFPVSFANCAGGQCAQSVAATRSNSEPAGGDNWPPNCGDKLPQGVERPPGTMIVDDVPTGTSNLEGCPAAHSDGTFSVDFGTDDAGVPLSVIDWHQLGTGWFGHTFFTDNVHPIDTSHTVVGHWKPSTPPFGQFAVYAHIPAAGATSTASTYTISTGFGRDFTATIDQGWYEDRNNEWAALGSYDFFGEGSEVSLTNANGEASGTTDVAFDAMMFIPEPGGHQTLSRLIPRGATWDYLSTGTVPSGWATKGFDSSGWTSGRAPLGAGATDVRTTINRTSPAHTTDLFRRSFEIDSPEDIVGVQMSLRYDDGITVWLNGHEIFSAGMPTSPDPPAPGTSALVCREPPAQDTYETTVINPIILLDQGRNVLAVEVHQCTPSSSDSVFDLDLQGVSVPAATNLRLDAAHTHENDDRVSQLDLSWDPVPDAQQYDLYELDWLAGSDATPHLVSTIPWDVERQDPDRIDAVVEPLFPRGLLRDYYVVTTSRFGGVSPPSEAVRVTFLPNVTNAADKSGPDVAMSLTDTPAAAPPGQRPTTPAGPVQTKAASLLPLKEIPATGERIFDGLRDAGSAFYRQFFPNLQTRVPDGLMVVANTSYSNRPVPNAEVQQLADNLQGRKTSSVPLTRTDYETVARECLRSPVPDQLGPDVCQQIDLFIPGENHRPATDHYANAIGANPRYGVLTRDVSPIDNKNSSLPRNWYTGLPNCNGTKPDGTSCDEYPFYASSENEGLNSHPAVALAWVDAAANSGVGGRLGNFYQGCNIRPASAPMVDDGGIYGVVPVPPGVPIDTTYICAPAAK